MIAILSDRKYTDRAWYQEDHQQLTRILRQRRIPYCDVYDTLPDDCDAVFVMGADFEWTESVIEGLNRQGISPILLGFWPDCFTGSYSSVCPDFYQSLESLMEVLKADGKRNILLFGTSSTSVCDCQKADILIKLGKRYDISVTEAKNSGTIEQCFKSVEADILTFDTILCTSDFVAIAMLRRLLSKDPSFCEKTSVISLMKWEVADFCHYRQYFRTLQYQDVSENVAKMGIYIYESLKRHNFVSTMSVKVNYLLDYEKTGFKKQTAKAFTGVEGTPVLFSYREGIDVHACDQEYRQMRQIEKVFSLLDETDYRILQGLLDGKSYDILAERCFMSYGSIKYRIKRLLDGSGLAHKEQLIELFGQYEICLE